MSESAVITYKVNAGSTETEKTVTESGVVQNMRSEAIASDASDQVVNLRCDTSALKLLWIMANKAIALSTYDASDELIDTINLTADVPLQWHDGDYHSKPTAFASDVASCKVTNTAGEAATLDIVVVEDATP